VDTPVLPVCLQRLKRTTSSQDGVWAREGSRSSHLGWTRIPQQPSGLDEDPAATLLAGRGSRSNHLGWTRIPQQPSGLDEDPAATIWAGRGSRSNHLGWTRIPTATIWARRGSHSNYLGWMRIPADKNPQNVSTCTHKGISH